MPVKDFYRKGAALGRRGLLQIVCEEIFRDGQLDARDDQLVRSQVAFLRLDAMMTRAVAERVREKFDEKRLGQARPTDPHALLMRVLRHACSDGEMDEKERAMIRGLSTLLGVSDATLADLVVRVAAESGDDVSLTGAASPLQAAVVRAVAAAPPAPAPPPATTWAEVFALRDRFGETPDPENAKRYVELRGEPPALAYGPVREACEALGGHEAFAVACADALAEACRTRYALLKGRPAKRDAPLCDFVEMLGMLFGQGPGVTAVAERLAQIEEPTGLKSKTAAKARA